mmetsp:Transcript_37706/g.31844  ORF Transcript_37706/g.31844 Transcript_37706/m.31844 type:complete len:130 (-) Transcript_37706:2127-2516(-)
MAFSCVSLSPRLSKSEKELPACLPLTPYIYLLFSRMCNFCKTLSVSPSISLGGLCVRGTIRALEVLDFVRILIATAGRRVCTRAAMRCEQDINFSIRALVFSRPLAPNRLSTPLQRCIRQTPLQTAHMQ